MIVILCTGAAIFMEIWEILEYLLMLNSFDRDLQ